jgi:very-short-patch-repair endonuclease
MSVDGPKTPPYVPFQAHQRGFADREIARIAERQHGLVTLGQLEGLGFSGSAVRKRVADGRIHRIYETVYAVGHPLLTVDGHRMAAVLACGPDAVLSHRSAAAHWGILESSRTQIDVTAPGRRGRMPDGIAAHRHGSLIAVDRTVERGVPCTTVARTLLDLAGVVSPGKLARAITEAEILRLFDLGAVQEVIGRSRRRRGVARLRLAIASHDPRDERARQGLERRFLHLCRRAELPTPEVNSLLLVDGVPIQPDFFWREARLIVETDGRATHGTARAFEYDRRRDQRLKVAGWDVIRCTWTQVTTDPDPLITTIRTLLTRQTPG